MNFQGFLCFLGLLLWGGVCVGQDDQNPCVALQPYHIVVLGSSTAAGTGPSVTDSTWVNRFTAYQQSIHPGNQVTNLAIGGTTTYHIMPTGFVPPSNRPNPNSNNNITQAIALGADAIIINMPSNDAANNFSFLEQMGNFDTIVNTAALAGIPVWVCTTQPRNGFGASQIGTQTQVRDSVLAAYGNKAIDFWNPFATLNNGIDPNYDSGDGVHLNDQAHGILFQKVKDEEILGQLFDTLSVTDHALLDFSLIQGHICGDSFTMWRGLVTNLGPASFADLPFYTTIEDLVNPGTAFFTDTIYGGIATCEADTFWLVQNTWQGGNWVLQTTLETMDLTQTNDTGNWVNYEVSGFPQLLALNDTVCLNEPAQLQAFSNALADTVFWYQNVMGGTILQGGNSFDLPAVNGTEIRFARAVRGPLFYSDSLSTVNTTNTNWNGIMFDLIANVSLTVDSLRARLNSTGLQGVVAYFRWGGHQGFQNTPNAWNIWGNDLVDVTSAGDFPVLHLPAMNISQGDTLGVYLHMQQASSTLSYRNAGSLGVFGNGDLTVLSGTGISHTFTNQYAPRQWAGEVFYHFGFNENGSCASARVGISATSSAPAIDLGPDTNIFVLDTFFLVPAPQLLSMFWSTGATTDSILVDSTTFGLGPHVFWVEGTDPWGCQARDTVVVTIQPNPMDTVINGISYNGFFANDIRVFPNPTTGSFRLDWRTSLQGVRIVVRNTLGEIVEETEISEASQFRGRLKGAPGIYFVALHTEESVPVVMRILKE